MSAYTMIYNFSNNMRGCFWEDYYYNQHSPCFGVALVVGTDSKEKLSHHIRRPSRTRTRCGSYLLWIHRLQPLHAFASHNLIDMLLRAPNGSMSCRGMIYIFPHLYFPRALRLPRRKAIRTSLLSSCHSFVSTYKVLLLLFVYIRN